MSTLFKAIHKRSFGGLGADTLNFPSRLLLYPFPGFSVHSLEQKSRVNHPVFRNNYFHEEKSAETSPFIMNTAQYPWNKSTRKEVDSVVTMGIFHLIILNTGSGVVSLL